MRHCPTDTGRYDLTATYWKHETDAKKYLCHDRRRGTFAFSFTARRYTLARHALWRGVRLSATRRLSIITV